MTIRVFPKENWLRSLAISFRLLLCTLVIALLTPGGAHSQDAVGSDNALKGELVDIGNGRHLNFTCAGSGSPTVVFLQGLGGSIMGWRKIRNPVASITRSCFYDRAGFGYSDPSSQPSTAENIANDLHSLLQAAAINEHVILVGHSLGGLYATLYTDKFAPQVAGLVLIDPSFANQFDYALPKAKTLMRSDENQFVAFLKTCQTLALEGKLSNESTGGCFHLPPNATTEEAAYNVYQGAKPTYYASGISEIESFFPLSQHYSLDGSEELARQRTFGSMPLIVLTAGNRAVEARLSDTENSQMATFLQRGHEALASRSTRGEAIVVPQSGHDIQADKPEVVIDAIRKVVLEVRHNNGH